MEQKKSFLRQLLSVGDPTERAAVVVRLSILSWPVVCRLAGIYRRTVLRRTCVVAVVGSYGKTTTTRAIRCALGISPDDQYPGNSSSYLAFNLFRLRRRDRFLVIETGVNRPGLMRQYAWMLRPDVAVITAIGTEHHLSFGTLEATRQEKAEMVRALSPQRNGHSECG